MTDSPSAKYALHQCESFITCVQSDTAALSAIANVIRFDTAGTVKVGAPDGTTYTATVSAGEVWTWMRINQVFDTGTTLTDAQIALARH